MSPPFNQVKRIVINSMAISGGEAANKVAIFVVYAAVSRWIGVEAFGQLALGLMLLYTFHIFGYAGLPTVLTRWVAKQPRSARRMLYQGYLAAVATSCLSAVCMVLLALAMRYQSTTTQVICLLSLAVPLYSLTMIAESVVKGRQAMHLIPASNLPGNLILIFGSLLVLWTGGGVLGVAGVIVGARAVTLALLHTVTLRAIAECPRYRTRPGLSFKLLGRSRVFLGSDGVAAIGASLFGLILSKFATEREVGMLSASFQLLQPAYIIYRSIGHGMFPQLVTAAKYSKGAVADLVARILGIISQFAFPVFLVAFTLAADLLELAYGQKGFQEAAYVLQILSLTLLLDPLNPVLGHGLWSTGADRAVFRIVLVNTFFNLVMGLLLIGGLGLTGAAVCAVLSSVLNMLQHYFSFTRFVFPLNLWPIGVRLLPAALASAAMVAFLPLHRLPTLVLALLVYFVWTIKWTRPSGLFASPATRNSPW